MSSTERWFASGSTQLLKITINKEISNETRRTGRISESGDTPAALQAVISWSPESRPNAMRLATSTAIGIESESHARFRANISSTVSAGSPLESTLSKIFTRKSTTNKKVMPKRAAKNGAISSFNT